MGQVSHQLAMPPLVIWHGAYDQGWKGYLCAAAFSHPAKASKALIWRIVEELLALGAVQRGDTIVDPFGGIGTTGIAASAHGLKAVCVELEPRFCLLGRQNAELHRRDWEAMGLPVFQMVEGDSRHLRAVLAAAGIPLAQAVVSSPPYSVEQMGGGGQKREDKVLRAMMDGYGDTSGQLGEMREGDIAAVVGSPPYAEIAAGAGGLNSKTPQHPGQQGGRSATSASQDTDQRYGESEGQLARMPKDDVAAVIGSPPYEGSLQSNLNGQDSQEGMASRARTKGAIVWGSNADGSRSATGYGEAPGQLGAMKGGAGVSAVVSSPPWLDARSETTASVAGQVPTRHDPEAMGQTTGNLSTVPAETFWEASLQIVRECHAILRPGGWSVWIVKSFVRDGRIVDFPGDWRRLCEHVGFETIQEVHAMLVSEERKPDLFDGERVTTRKRSSFFRRLYEAKHPENAIDYECVLFMRKR